ncbi:MAG: hypothetical protein QNJ15_05485 [Erythrobacter sp.]|nr:hypothetical protein [Erythrobacter sp.]
MTRILSLSAALAAFVLAPAAMADDADDGELIKAAATTEVAATPAKLVSFDGEKEFLKTSTRLRIWRADVGYTLTVSAEGEVTQCELTEKFRRAYINKSLCKVLTSHHEFEPARDASDMPIESQYTSRLVYLDMRNKK